MDLFIQRIISLSPKLVIGDTLARCMPGGDENSAKDMGLLVEHTDKVRRRVDCTFMWAHPHESCCRHRERIERLTGRVRHPTETVRHSSPHLR